MSLIEKRLSHAPELALLYCALIWGTTFGLVKSAVATFDPVLLTSYRFLLAALLLAPVLIVRRSSPFGLFPKGILVGTILGISFITQTIGLVYTTPSNSAFITGLFVAFVPPLTFFMRGERPNRYRLLAMLLALIGLWFLTGGLAQINRGDLWTILTAFTAALHILLLTDVLREQPDSYVLCFQQFITVGILGLLINFVFGLQIVLPHASITWAIFFLAIFPSIGAYLAQSYAQRRVPELKAALFFALEPVCAAVFSWAVLGETMTAAKLFGGMLIVSAIVVHEIPTKR